MLNFALKLEDANYKSHWNILVFCGQRKMMSDLNMPLGKMPNFILFLLFGLTLIIKLRNFDFESHWNTLMFFDKRRYGVRFEYIPWKNVWVCFIFDFWVHFSQKNEKFWFWKSLKCINVFLIKKWCEVWMCPAKHCLYCFKRRCLSMVLATSWEIRILNFIEMVYYFSIKESKFVPGFLSYLYFLALL